MKKLIIASVASLLCVSLAPVAVFATDSISDTGPGSYNSIINEDTKKITVTCNNKVDVVNVNGQSTGSGTATVDSNGFGGDATSGGSSNLNDFVASLGISCAPAAQTTPTPPAGGQGGGTVTPAPVVKAAATTLPNTGAASIALGTVVALALGTGAAFVTRKLVNQR